MEAALVGEDDQLMAEALPVGSMLAGQEEVHSKLPKVGKGRVGSQRKHQTSPAYVGLAQEVRMALRMARIIREGHKVGWLITRRKKIKGLGIQLASLASEREGLGKEGWLEYASVLEKGAAKLKEANEEAEGWERSKAVQDDGASIRRRRRQGGCSLFEWAQEGKPSKGCRRSKTKVAKRLKVADNV